MIISNYLYETKSIFFNIKKTIIFGTQLAKRREMEYSKMSTLRLMMEQEKKNLENLKSSSNSNRNDILRAETNIIKLSEQIKQMCGEVSTLHFNILPLS